MSGETGVEEGCGDFEGDRVSGWGFGWLAEVVRDDEIWTQDSGDACFKVDWCGEVRVRD